MIKANKKRARSSRHEEQDVPDQQPLASLRATAVPGSTPIVTIYDDDYDVAEVAIIATNKNIAYENPAIQQTDSSASVEHEYAQIHLF